MSDELAVTESIPTITPEVIDPPVPAVDPRYEPEVADKVRRLAEVGLSRTQIAIAVKVSPTEIESGYGAEFAASQASFQQVVASAAMEQVKMGNPQMIQYLCKAKLGWSEHNVVEHVGTINAVVSAKPLTKEEFAKRYIEQSED